GIGVIFPAKTDAIKVARKLLKGQPMHTSLKVLQDTSKRDSIKEDIVGELVTSEALYLVLTDERTLEERRRITVELRCVGVEVVDAGPEQIAPALADAYLDLKARGRL